MSRSYKKHCIMKCAGDTSYKKIFNRKLRRTTRVDEIPDGNAYRKMNESWEIYDFICDCSWENFKDWDIKIYGSQEEAWKEWKRRYGSK